MALRPINQCYGSFRHNCSHLEREFSHKQGTYLWFIVTAGRTPPEGTSKETQLHHGDQDIIQTILEGFKCLWEHSLQGVICNIGESSTF